MKLTKFQHACFTVEKDGQSIVVDPGVFTHDFIMPDTVAAIFITHSHVDHMNSQFIISILREHPKAVLLAHESIVRDFPNEHTQVVNIGETIEVGGITLQLVGGTHETIDSSMPVPSNIGVIIESSLYYPGDSFYQPAQTITELALPVSAPWLTIGRSLDLVRALKPHFVFPTHDAILSTEGQTLVDTIIKNATKDLGIDYQRINGKTIEIS